MVSIIILSYNTSRLLQECLTSLEKALRDTEHEVIVVDNFSQDDSVEMIKRHFKHVRIVENKENEGFSKGCNVGASHAKGEYLLFLNSDTDIKKNPLRPMLNAFESDEKVAVVGGALKNFDGTDQRSFGNFYGLTQVMLMLLGGEKTELKVQRTDRVSEVDWVSGGFMMVRKNIFDMVHGFDEHFFMYIEDMELCYRIQNRGYKILHHPDAVVAHRGQGSSSKGFAIIHIYKGLKYFYKKHKNGLSYVILMSLLRCKAWVAIMIGSFKGDSALVDTYKKAIAQV